MPADVNTSQLQRYVACCFCGHCQYDNRHPVHSVLHVDISVETQSNHACSSLTSMCVWDEPSEVNECPICDAAANGVVPQHQMPAAGHLQQGSCCCCDCHTSAQRTHSARGSRTRPPALRCTCMTCATAARMQPRSEHTHPCTVCAGHGVTHEGGWHVATGRRQILP